MDDGLAAVSTAHDWRLASPSADSLPTPRPTCHMGQRDGHHLPAGDAGELLRRHRVDGHAGAGGFRLAEPLFPRRSYLEPTWTPLAIYAGDDLVGFAMFGRDDETGHWWIMRIHDRRPASGQGLWHGRAALLIDLMVERHGCGEIFLGYAPGNDVAGRLYARMGFAPTGEMVGGEIVARLSRRRTRADAPDETRQGWCARHSPALDIEIASDVT